MEPAVYRREHQAVLERMDRALGHVAMEPAVYRREHTPYANQIRDPVSSQWSPPFIGGSTISLVERGKRGTTVAMEPAVYWREHPGDAAGSRGAGGVAMEPVVYRREHRFRT